MPFAISAIPQKLGTMTDAAFQQFLRPAQASSQMSEQDFMARFNPQPQQPRMSEGQFRDHINLLGQRVIDIPKSMQIQPESMQAEFTQYNPYDPNQTKPNPDGIMASGKKVYNGAIATNDPSLLGARIFVPQLNQTFTVEDKLGPTSRAKFQKTGQHQFDIVNLGSKSSALQFGRQLLDFVILR